MEYITANDAIRTIQFIALITKSVKIRMFMPIRCVKFMQGERAWNLTNSIGITSGSLKRQRNEGVTSNRPPEQLHPQKALPHHRGRHNKLLQNNGREGGNKTQRNEIKHPIVDLLALRSRRPGHGQVHIMMMELANTNQPQQMPGQGRPAFDKDRNQHALGLNPNLERFPPGNAAPPRRPTQHQQHQMHRQAPGYTQIGRQNLAIVR